MKQRLLLALVLTLLLFLAACSEKDNNDPDIKIYGYKLDQFVNPLAVLLAIDAAAPDTSDFRNLYAYQIVSATDGFSPRNSSYAGYDLPWESFKTGFVVPEDNFKTWFADPLLPGAFKVRNTGTFRLYRKIDVITQHGTKMVELNGLPVYSIPNWDSEPEDAILLSDLLQGIATLDSLRIVCHDGYGQDKIYYPESIADGYYLLNSERTIFPTADIPNNQKRMKKVKYLQVFGSPSAQDHAFELAPEASADISFDLPVNLAPFTKTELPGYGS